LIEIEMDVAVRVLTDEQIFGAVLVPVDATWDEVRVDIDRASAVVDVDSRVELRSVTWGGTVE